MRFPFTYNLTVGETIVAEIFAVGTIEANPDDVSLSGIYPGWSVATVEVAGVDGGEVEVTDDHHLYERLLVSMLNTYRRDIDTAWEAHMRALGYQSKLRLVS